MNNAEQPKTSLFKTIAQFLALLILGTTAATNLLVVYTLFAPDEFPKPIYLMYRIPVAPAAATSTGVEAGMTATGEVAAAPGETPVETPTEKSFISSIPIIGQLIAKPTPTPEPVVRVTEITPGQGIMIDTGTKIVNLAEPGGKKFIRVTATLEFAPNDPKYTIMTEEEKTAYLTAFNTELNSRLPVVDDIIITLLSTKDYQSVYTAEGKNELRQQIIDSINTRMPEYKVIYVYFKEFVMQ